MRGLNTLLWTYVSVARYNEFTQLVLGYEGIICGERIDMYYFVSSFIKHNAPGMPMSEIKIFSGDQFFS